MPHIGECRRQDYHSSVARSAGRTQRSWQTTPDLQAGRSKIAEKPNRDLVAMPSSGQSRAGKFSGRSGYRRSRSHCRRDGAIRPNAEHETFIREGLARRTASGAKATRQGREPATRPAGQTAIGGAATEVKSRERSGLVRIQQAHAIAAANGTAGNADRGTAGISKE